MMVQSQLKQRSAREQLFGLICPIFGAPILDIAGQAKIVKSRIGIFSAGYEKFSCA
jgi:hypothetical protein